MEPADLPPELVGKLDTPGHGVGSHGEGDPEGPGHDVGRILKHRHVPDQVQAHLEERGNHEHSDPDGSGFFRRSGL